VVSARTACGEPSRRAVGVRQGGGSTGLARVR